MIDLKQKELADWQKENFGESTVSDMLHGMAEEVGEMAHWYLKGKQAIRGISPREAKEKMADGFGDVVVFGVQAMSSLGLDAEAILKEVIEGLKSDPKDKIE